MLIEHANKAFHLQKTDNLSNAVLDAETGTMMEHRHLLKHKDPSVQKIWTTSAADEFGRLFQGVGK